MLDPAIMDLKEISKSLTEFIKYKTCDTYCPATYPESKYYPEENICKCEDPYFNSNGICVKCEDPNDWHNGLCIDKCVDGYKYNNGICECVPPYTVQPDGKCVNITDIEKFIADVKLLNDNIVAHTPYNYNTNPLLDVVDGLTDLEIFYFGKFLPFKTRIEGLVEKCIKTTIVDEVETKCKISSQCVPDILTIFTTWDNTEAQPVILKYQEEYNVSKFRTEKVALQTMIGNLIPLSVC